MVCNQLKHLEMLAGFIARSSEAIETLGNIILVFLNTEFEGKRPLPTLITNFLAV